MTRDELVTRIMARIEADGAIHRSSLDQEVAAFEAVNQTRNHLLSRGISPKIQEIDPNTGLWSSYRRNLFSINNQNDPVAWSMDREAEMERRRNEAQKHAQRMRERPSPWGAPADMHQKS